MAKVKLEDVCERGSSNLKQSDVVDKDGDYPIYGASGYIGKVEFYHQKQPYVAVVKDGARIGRTTLHSAKSSVIGTMQYLLPKDNVLPEYLCYVVKYMHLEKYFTDATIPHIYFKDYKNKEFNLASLDRQKEIISTLHKIEKVIEYRTKELELLDELIKARFVEMFGDLRINSKGWDIKTFDELSYLITDGEHATPRRTEQCQVCDGCSYELSITYKDNRKKKLTGDLGGGTVDKTVTDFICSIPEMKIHFEGEEDE